MRSIEEIFSNRKAGILGKHKKSAVMILLCEQNGKEHIIFEIRALSLRHQPGDVCLPGGKIEEGESPKEAAIRETLEELKLNKEDISFIGEMDYFVSPYGSIMYPFVARLNKKEITPNEAEVDHIFMVPVDYLMSKDPLLYEMEIGPNSMVDFPYHLIKGGKNYKFTRGNLNQYFYEYQGNVIWGFTAMIIKEFVDIIKKSII